MSLLPVPPKLPGIPDPLRRVRIPRDLGAVTALGPVEEDGGLRPGGAERIWEAARRLYRTGLYPAVALTIRREGRVVLDRAIGHAKPGQPVRHDDPFVIFSAAKAVTAALTHLCDERGLLHVDDRVAEYLPEFARYGKHRITIEHVLTHRAGVPALPADALDLDVLADPAQIAEMVFDQRLRSRPGKLLAYHAISGGFILGLVIEAVTGKPLRQVLADELLDPLGFRWGNYGVAPEDVPRVALSAVTGPPPVPPLSTVLTRAFGVSTDEVTRISNDPRFLTGVLPAANVVMTGNELSRFFELLREGGTLDGVQVLEPRTVRRMIAERTYRQFDLTLGAPIRHSAGFMLGAQAISLYGPDTEWAFGHLGYTNVLGWADPERALSVGLITSGKPLLHHGLPDLWALTRRIGVEAPKVDRLPLLLRRQ